MQLLLLRPGTALLALTTAPPNSRDSPSCCKRPYLGEPTASPNIPDPPPRACGRASFVQPVQYVTYVTHDGTKNDVVASVALVVSVAARD